MSLEWGRTQSRDMFSLKETWVPECICLKRPWCGPWQVCMFRTDGLWIWCQITLRYTALTSFSSQNNPEKITSFYLYLSLFCTYHRGGNTDSFYFHLLLAWLLGRKLLGNRKMLSTLELHGKIAPLHICRQSKFWCLQDHRGKGS